MGPGLKSRSCLTASGTGRLVEPSHMLQQSLRAIGGSHRHRLVTRNLPHRPVLGLERPLGIGGGPERPRLLQPGFAYRPKKVDISGPTLAFRCRSSVPWTASSPRRRASWRISCGVDLPCDHRKGVLYRLPFVGRGWYAKPACAYMLEAGLAQVAALQVEPRRHSACRPAVSRAGAAAHGAQLARGRGALRQAGDQQPRGFVRSESRISLFHEDLKPSGGWRGMQLAPDPHGCGRGDALAPRLRDGAALQQQLPPGARFHHGGGVYGSGQGPTSPGGSAEALPQMSQDRLSGDAGRAKEAPPSSGCCACRIGTARPSIAASRRRACGASTGSLAWRRSPSGRSRRGGEWRILSHTAWGGRTHHCHSRRLDAIAQQDAERCACEGFRDLGVSSDV